MWRFIKMMKHNIKAMCFERRNANMTLVMKEKKWTQFLLKKKNSDQLRLNIKVGVGRTPRIFFGGPQFWSVCLNLNKQVPISPKKTLFLRRRTNLHFNIMVKLICPWKKIISGEKQNNRSTRQNSFFFLPECNEKTERFWMTFWPFSSVPSPSRWSSLPGLFHQPCIHTHSHPHQILRWTPTFRKPVL